MDTLSKILDLLRFNGTFYFATNFNGAWSIEVPSYKSVARFHYVTQGHCWVRVPGMEEPQMLSVGDLIIIPHGAKHILSDTPDSPPITLDEAFTHTGYNGQGIFHFGEDSILHGTQLVCGHFEFNEEYKHSFIDYLPQLIICNENEGTEFSWLKDSLHFLANVAKSNQVGSSAIIKRLSEIIFIQSVRFWNERQGSNEGFLAALNDPRISKGLMAFHNNYAADWTVERLAEEAHMSRSLFSDRFKQYLNLSPMQYVTHWRMQNAKRMLVESQLSIEQIASDIGYDSLASFSKAFKRIVNKNPGEYRKERTRSNAEVN
ncbi:AraC family transcriptional regulator [Agarilytica rhodophyticola]|uniref:AraC family transcriptional regulator n=1 Tax=Agarilytica rhodophyticola TaxID=1737490 RepID=UPI000B3413FB|nr:AraC family transcriptional regulator [Agarilytica rhodophyticola]